MKKLLTATTAALAGVLLAVPLARASIVNPLTFNPAVNAAQAVDPTLAPPANDGKHDFAVGGFEGIEMEHVGFSVQSGPQGQAPSGQVSETFAKGEKFRWKVACLEVEENFARIGIVPSEAPPSNAAKEGALYVEDGGPGPAGDKYEFVTEEACGFFRFEIHPVPIMSGNILVHDN